MARARTLIPLLVVFAASAVTFEFLVWRRQAQNALRQRADELARQVESSRRSSDEATALAAAGRYDLLAQVSRELVERVLLEFDGYSQLTRRGNHFLITGLATRFERGHAEVTAQAIFDWRWGLYHGPIEVRYAVFAGVSPDDQCVLHFRVADVKPLARWRLFNRLWAPILTLRMQDSLRLRDVPLPLALRTPRPARNEPARERRRLGRSGVRIFVPPRPWDLDGRRVLPIFDEERLALVVESPRGAPADGAAAELAAPPRGVDLVARLAFVSALLSSAVRGADDLEISVERLPRLWQNQGRLFGMPFDNHLDLRNVSGVIDIRDCRTTLVDRELGLELELSGRFAGFADARLFGFSFSLPFRVRPAQFQRLPLKLVAGESGLGLVFEAREIRVPLEVETSVARVPLRGSYPLSIPPEVMDRALALPGLRVTSVALPRAVERGRITVTKRVPVRVDWSLTLPHESAGFVRAHGDLRFDDGGGGA